MRNKLNKINTIRLYRLFTFALFALILTALSACGPATDKSVNNNLTQKSEVDDASGGFVWGQNDPKTGKHKEEASDKEVILRQEEVLRRQEEEKARLEREKQDILRQKYHNEIQILVGMETEWIHPQTLEEIKDCIRQFDLDYIVGSVHHVRLGLSFRSLCVF